MKRYETGNEKTVGKSRVKIYSRQYIYFCVSNLMTAAADRMGDGMLKQIIRTCNGTKKFLMHSQKYRSLNSSMLSITFQNKRVPF